MKIHILCDLHVEFGNFVPPVVGADVVVLAGDVHVKDRGLQWIFDQKFEIPVLYVLGNHEFYREKFPGLKSPNTILNKMDYFIQILFRAVQ